MNSKTEFKRINKLIEKISTLVHELDHEISIELHQKIDQFYYMQKQEELKLQMEQILSITEQFNQAHERLQKSYIEIFTSWRKDVRWINVYRKASIGRISIDKAGTSGTT